MSRRIQSAIANVDKLLSAASKVKKWKSGQRSAERGDRGIGRASAKAGLKAAQNALREAKSPAAKKDAQARVKTWQKRVKANSTSASVVMSSAKKLKILAMLGVGSKPNLRLLNKLISREIITAQEVVDAVGEALFLKRVNKRVIEAITSALTEALGTGDVIDVDMEEAA